MGSKKGVIRDFWAFRGTDLYNSIIRLYSATPLSPELKRDLWTLWADSNWESFPTNERISDTWENREGGKTAGWQ